MSTDSQAFCQVFRLCQPIFLNHTGILGRVNLLVSNLQIPRILIIDCFPCQLHLTILFRHKLITEIDRCRNLRTLFNLYLINIQQTITVVSLQSQNYLIGISIQYSFIFFPFSHRLCQGNRRDHNFFIKNCYYF